MVDWNEVKREIDILMGIKAQAEREKILVDAALVELAKREAAVKAREEALEKGVKDLTQKQNDFDADMVKRENAIKNVRTELSLRNARVKTLEEDVVKADKKTDKAREEKGQATAQITVLKKRVSELEQIIASQSGPAVEEKVTVTQVPEPVGASPAEMLKG